MNFINGSEQIRNDFGYWPSFHDDYIESIQIINSSIEFIIECKTTPQGYEQYKVKIIFDRVSHFELEGELYGTCSIILDLKFSEDDEMIKTELYSSLGTGGVIRSKTVSVVQIT